jgi:pyruvate,orthophosphate dikinase
MFLTEERLPIIQSMILSESPDVEEKALKELREAQRNDFGDLLKEMDGLPVTVRLLDPPLHEFLPELEELVEADARNELDADGIAMLQAARKWRERNPMMGTRGVRLAWVKPGLYEMQVEALLDAVADRITAGGNPIVEIMIPLIVSGNELAGARKWIESVLGRHPEVASVKIGTMVETPRAALVADELAYHADFFSFGTNDLTQLTFGFSRDDIENRIMNLYLEKELLEANPFQHVDANAVIELVRLGIERGRSTKPDLPIGVCGEHGGDPTSIELFAAAGVDYVSCSPPRVPIARLAAAHVAISARGDR